MFLTTTAAAFQGNSPGSEATREFGRIEWHGATATLIAGGARPLGMAAATLSTCLGVSVGPEEPHYRYLGDLLEFPPGSHAYIPKPGRLEVNFAIDRYGSPTDLRKLLEDSVRSVNQFQPFGYEVRERPQLNGSYFSFVPTHTRDETGAAVKAPPYLDSKVTIPKQTSRINELAFALTEALRRATGQQFSCCQAYIAGIPWGMRFVTYEASGRAARDVLEDLLDLAAAHESYSLRCEPLDKRFCFINVEPRTGDRKPKGDGVCTALGWSGY